MWEVEICYINEEGHNTQVDLVFVHDKEEALKRCEELTKELGVECKIGFAVYVD